MILLCQRVKVGMKKILIIDDEADFRELMSDYLALRFHHFPIKIDVASDGLQALEMLKVCAYDLMVTDVKMPRMNGHQLLAKIEELAESLRPRFIVVASGHETFEHQQPGQQVIFMEKPIELSVLGRFVDAALGSSEEREIGPQTLEPFLHSTKEILLQQCQLAARPVETSVRKNSSDYGTIRSTVALREARMVGQLSLCFEENFCLTMIQRLTGRPVQRVDEDVKHSLARVMQSIYLRANKDIGRLGMSFSAASPTVTLGRRASSHDEADGLYFASRFATESGEFVMELNLKKTGQK